MLNLNIDYSTAVILSSAQKRKPTIEELREKCIDNAKTVVMYDAESKRVIFRFAFASTLYKVKVTDEREEANIVAETNVSADYYAKNKKAYLKALHSEINAGKLDEFLRTQSNLVSERLTKAHAKSKANAKREASTEHKAA